MDADQRAGAFAVDVEVADVELAPARSMRARSLEKNAPVSPYSVLLAIGERLVEVRRA